MSYQTQCPSCGATIVFALGATLLKVCEQCGLAVARKGARLETYGKVAELIPTLSILALGVRGGYEGAPPFTLVGRLQKDHGSGTWDEWLMAFSGGAWAWLSEAQGKFHYMGVAALPPVPEFQDLRVGTTVDLGPPGTFVVTEVGEARFVSAAGELPFATAPGSRLRYADLSGPGEKLATLDYGTGHRAEALYVGREVTPGELGLSGLPSEEDRRKKVAGAALSCPQCAGPLEVRAPDKSQRVACPYCGTLLDAGNFAVLEVLHGVPVQPKIPLGAKGRLVDGQWSVIGFLERSVTYEDERYPWQEYLLYDPRRGFRWLVESKGHWSFVTPIAAGDVSGGGLLSANNRKYAGQTFRRFQTGRARVDVVIGEFYWAVARGEEVDTDDYVAPPLMLSSEGDRRELNWSLGTYLPAGEVWRAFDLPGGPPAQSGIAPHQPSPYAGRVGRAWRIALAGAAALFFVYMALSIVGAKVVHTQFVPIAANAVSGSPETALFTEPFRIASSGNVEVQVTAPVSNSWLYLDGALINEETGALDEFDVEVSYYFGSDSDGSWSEGGQRARAFLASVPVGRYVMRLGPQWEAGKPPPAYDLRVRSRVPRLYQMLLAMLALCVWPIVLGWRWARFEAERWSESDFSTSGASRDDE